MYLSDARPLIQDAYAARYALPAFNVCSAEMVRACIEAAESANAPILLQTYPADLAQVAAPHMAALVRSMANEVRVPVALHLDHGPDDAMVLACLRAGYGSVMFDGSDLALEALQARVERLTWVAHGQGAALEVAAESFDAGRGARTVPGEARRLHAAGADMVAVSVGSEHGRSAALDLDLLRRIAEAVSGPLVLHGGSGISADDLGAARELGVVKVNVGSACYRAMRATWNASEDAPSHRAVYERARDALREVALERILATGAEGRA